jgi:stress response protein YsnF
LNLYKDNIQNQDWSAPPVYDAGTATAATDTKMSGTAAADTMASGVSATDTMDVGSDAFTEKDIDVPVMGEELVAGKRAVVKDEVRVYKEPITEERQVSDTVRKERVTVDGADDVQGADVSDAAYADSTSRRNR